jgi:tight adherence protein B
VDGEIRVTSVALDTGDMDLAPLQSVATATGGQVIRVAEPAQLLAAFRGVAADLTNRFVLTWTAELVPAPATQLSVEVSVSTDAGTVTDDLVVLNTRVPVITPPRVYEPPQAPIGLLANEAGLVLGVVTAFLSVLIGGVLILSGAGERRRRLRLASQLPAWDGIGDGPTAAIIATASLTDRAAEAMDRLPTPEGLEERLGVLLERADWPMRSSEFQLVTVGATFGGLVIPLILFRSLPLAVLVALAGAAGPYVMLKLAVARRAAKFEDQLPSVLMLLAGALRAGHGFTTALEGTVRETDEPARSELRRASVEQRLGRSVDSALLGVAERLQSSDLRWVVNAIAIQQEVGGNLAELLDNVASTLRDRASLGRNVKALAAEGRYSAWIIGLLPFAMFMIMTVINPEYVRFLYTDPRGLAMSVIAIVLMAIGGLVLRKLVQPRF